MHSFLSELAGRLATKVTPKTREESRKCLAQQLLASCQRQRLCSRLLSVCRHRPVCCTHLVLPLTPSTRPRSAEEGTMLKRAYWIEYMNQHASFSLSKRTNTPRCLFQQNIEGLCSLRFSSDSSPLCCTIFAKIISAIPQYKYLVHVYVHGKNKSTVRHIGSKRRPKRFFLQQQNYVSHTKFK